MKTYKYQWRIDYDTPRYKMGRVWKGQSSRLELAEKALRSGITALSDGKHIIHNAEIIEQMEQDK